MCATCHPLYSFQYLLRQATPTFTLPHTAWRPRSLLASSSTNLLGVPVYHRPHPHEATVISFNHQLRGWVGGDHGQIMTDGIGNPQACCPGLRARLAVDMLQGKG